MKPLMMIDSVRFVPGLTFKAEKVSAIAKRFYGVFGLLNLDEFAKTIKMPRVEPAKREG